MPPPLTSFSGSLILTGPTGSGKSGVALDLAKRIGAEIIAADSMTLYRGMDIGTAKPTPEERACVPHHLFDVLEVWEPANVAWWLEKAAEACAAIRSRDKIPLFVGGTPFYLKALLCGLFDAPPVDPEMRARLEAEAERIGVIELHRRLNKVDPKSALRLHPNDVRRVVRALEVYESTGKPLSSFQQTWKTATFEAPENSAYAAPTLVPCVILEWPRELLIERIDRRVETMIAQGWLEEVRRLRESPRSPCKEAIQAIGYKELASFIDDPTSNLSDTTALIQLRTRQFAKRQMTWFRSLGHGRFIRADEPELTERILAGWELCVGCVWFVGE